MIAAVAIGLAALAGLSTSLLAHAETGGMVYRCGSEYTQRPCAAGRLVDAADPVTAARTADALKTAEAERRLAEQMARDRRADEAAFRPARAASLGPAKAAEPASAAKPKHKTKKRPGTRADDDDFVARTPKTKVAKS